MPAREVRVLAREALEVVRHGRQQLAQLGHLARLPSEQRLGQVVERVGRRFHRST